MNSNGDKYILRNIFAFNLRKIRKKQSISQEVLADRASLHRTYISSVERAERNISIDNIECIASALGVEVVELLKKMMINETASRY